MQRNMRGLLQLDNPIAPLKTFEENSKVQAIWCAAQGCCDAEATANMPLRPDCMAPDVASELVVAARSKTYSRNQSLTI
jgi:hypothetical protein